MRDNNTETELRAAFARETARLPIPGNFEHKVRERIRARQRDHRNRVIRLSALSATLAIAAAVVIARADDTNTVQTLGPPSSATIQVTAQQLAASTVTELATPPSNIIPGFKLFTTERGLVLWGIRDFATGQVTAARYSAQDNRWTTMESPAMSQPPSESGADVSVVSTGTELLVLGRENLALDLLTGKWRPVAEMPRPVLSVAFAFWTGKEAVILGTSTSPTGTQFVGHAFDPIANSWRAIAAPPENIRVMNSFLGTSGAVLWTGKEALVFGIRDAPLTVLFFIYDPATDQWRAEPSPLDGDRPETGATDGRTAYWVHRLTVATGLVLETGQRIEIPPVPLPDRAESRLVLFGGQLVSLDGSTLVVFDDAINQWISGPAVPGNTAVVDGNDLYVIEFSTTNPRLTRVQPG
jgi:hypothetical protein